MIYADSFEFVKIVSLLVINTNINAPVVLKSLSSASDLQNAFNVSVFINAKTMLLIIILVTILIGLYGNKAFEVCKHTTLRP
jgi:hypothetical protein